MGGEKADLLFRLWELVLLQRSLLVLADSPDRSAAAVFALMSLIFPLRQEGPFWPYLTVFDAQFPALQAPGGGWPGGVAGATNPLFAKLSAKFTACLDLRAEHAQRLRAKHGAAPAAKHYLTHAPHSALRPPLQLSKLLGRGENAEERHINAQIVRKKLLALTLSFLEPLHLFLARDCNDLKVFELRAFLDFVGGTALPVDAFYPCKADLQRVYTDFARTGAFRAHMKAHFNVHARRG